MFGNIYFVLVREFKKKKFIFVTVNNFPCLIVFNFLHIYNSEELAKILSAWLLRFLLIIVFIRLILSKF